MVDKAVLVRQIFIFFCGRKLAWGIPDGKWADAWFVNKLYRVRTSVNYFMSNIKPTTKKEKKKRKA